MKKNTNGSLKPRVTAVLADVDVPEAIKKNSGKTNGKTNGRIHAKTNGKVNGKTNGKTNGNAEQESIQFKDSFENHELLKILSDVRNGNFDVRMPNDRIGISGKI